MTFTKHMVLLGGVLALIAWFVPYGTVHVGPVHARVSAFDVIKGIDSLGQVSNVEGNEAIDSEIAKADDNSTTKGYTALVFGPPLLLLVIGGIAEKRKKLGRLGGVGAMLLGAWAAVFAAALISVLGQDASEGAGVGAGCYLFLAGGALGGLGGLLALIKPDRG